MESGRAHHEPRRASATRRWTATIPTATPWNMTQTPATPRLCVAARSLCASARWLDGRGTPAGRPRQADPAVETLGWTLGLFGWTRGRLGWIVQPLRRRVQPIRRRVQPLCRSVQPICRSVQPMFPGALPLFLGVSPPVSQCCPALNDGPACARVVSGGQSRRASWAWARVFDSAAHRVTARVDWALENRRRARLDNASGL